MARFIVNRPVTTKQHFVVVDGDLKEGRHRFQLVVVDSQGNKSKPAIVIVTIKRRTTLFVR